MIGNKILNIFLKQQRISVIRTFSSQINIEKLEEESNLSPSDFISDEAKARDAIIEQKRNKSRLREQDRSILMNKNPYPEPCASHHGSLKYIRRTYGRYGEASGVNPSLCWPVKEELDSSKEYERLKHPYTIPEMIAEAAKLRKEKEERTAMRQEEIVKRMQKLEGWKQDLFNRIAKKEAEARSVKERKERLVEEVKRHFGYSVDPKDERFKEMLEKKEKEQRKALKEERRKQKEAKLMDKISKKGNPDDEKESDDKEESSKNKNVKEE
ncbi:large ribosomal subunit protein mL64-like [Diabrotica undecimpunctata]|uniref:large ribosomal subunit protein mL64-like n=1 Tax=Diabrotica undecimpunctata TaxID=50387 RepID=UPI003B63B97C